jgi:DNA-binding transcriptional regulator YdaS (Cro superfamily)
MKLSAWVREIGGNKEAGRFLGVERNCAYAWVKGTALPRAHVMKAIVQKTRGKVTYKDMVDEYLEKRASGKKKTVKKKKAKSKKPAKKKVKVDPGF